jgi:hypothetical protein
MNFDTLVLNACQNSFGKPLTINPLASIPGAPPYLARGIWTVRVVDVILDDGSQLTTRTLEIDVRLSELPVLPMQGDQITIVADIQSEFFGLSIGSPLLLQVDDARLDSGGAAKLIVKRVTYDGI